MPLIRFASLAVAVLVSLQLTTIGAQVDTDRYLVSRFNAIWIRWRIGS